MYSATMYKLSKLQNILLSLGALLMVVGACLFVAQCGRQIACWVFLVGTVLFAVIQSMQQYEGRNLVVRRLKRIMNVSDLLILLSGILMVDTQYNFLLPLFRLHGSDGYYAYIEYVYNKWVVLLLIGALLQLYTTYRISGELGQDEPK